MTNEEQNPKLEVLVVEDNLKHLKDAKKEIAQLQASGIEIIPAYAINYLEAQEAMQTKRFSGIVSDVFFPESKERVSSEETVNSCSKVLRIPERPKDSEYATYEQFLEYIFDEIKSTGKPSYGSGEYLMYHAFDQWSKGKELAPLGVLVAEEAKSNKIPLVFCSSLYHHSYAAQPVCTYARDSGIAFIDSTSDYIKESKEKNWKGALDVLLQQINRGEETK